MPSVPDTTPELLVALLERQERLAEQNERILALLHRLIEGLDRLADGSFDERESVSPLQREARALQEMLEDGIPFEA